MDSGKQREGFASRLGFILVSAGCAIGIGNVWRFPTVTGQNGGGVFVLFYLLFLVLMGVPVLTMELAVGRLLGEQFLALLDGEDGTGNSLYFTLAAEADRQAMAIRKAFEEKGVKLLHDSYTNQQFFVLPDEWHEALSKDFAMTHMGKPDKTHTAVRICTSWATKAENVETLIEAVKKL